MTEWLIETLIWTAALIALVLVLRRPVTRMFGPRFAYALWTLPMLRLLMPPITLPAWLKPESAANEALTNLPDQSAISPVALQEAVTATQTDTGAAAPDLATPITLTSDLKTFIEALSQSGPLVEIGCTVWLIGAAIFMVRRFGSYFQLRRELLASAREVGREGKVRLIETPATKAPLAFGVADPVIAVPEGFMAQPDIAARNLALAHELAHHKGHDLLINVAVQPLFALHWWNPLGRYGWLALRRDQEAACDARVMAHQPLEHRATYANLIASFAAVPDVAASNAALAAAMACPVLGDKSIIHRLRSLNMTETSNRRRLAGRFMMGAAIIALPLTASITYAETIAQEAPQAPPAPAAPAAPNAVPAPPAPPAPLEAASVLSFDPDLGVEIEQPAVAQESALPVDEGAGDSSIEPPARTRVRRFQISGNGRELSKEERDAIMAEVKASLDEVRVEVMVAKKEIEMALIEIDGMGSIENRIWVNLICGDAATRAKFPGDLRDSDVCVSSVAAEALRGLKEAREGIAESDDLESDTRENVLRAIDKQIENWQSDNS